MWRHFTAWISAALIGGNAMAANTHVTTECADELLCAALDRAIAAAPELPNPLGLRLVVERKIAHSLSVHLVWHGAVDGRSDTIGLDVMDASISPDMYDKFMQDLVRFGGLPFSTSQ